MTTYKNNTSTNTSNDKKYPPFVTAKDLMEHNITFDIYSIKTIDFKYSTGPTKMWVLNIGYQHPRFEKIQNATLTFYYFRKSGKPNTVLADMFEPIMEEAYPIVDARIVEKTRTWTQDGEQHTFTELVPSFTLVYPDLATPLEEDGLGDLEVKAPF